MFGTRAVMAVALALLAGVLPLSAAAGATPAQRSILNVPFKGVAAPGTTFDLVESVIDYGPGAKSPAVTTKTAYYLSVVGGELTVDVDGSADVLAAGKGVAVPTGAKLTLSNASAGQNARLFVTTLLAVGAIDPVHQPNFAGVKVFATGRRTMVNAPAVIDVIQLATEYDPGFKTPNHVMNEFHLFVHLAGQNGYHYVDGGAETYGPGSQAVMYEGRPGWMANDGPTPSAWVNTYLARPGKPLTSAVTAPAPPNTGSGVIDHGRNSGWSLAGSLALALAAAAAGTLAVRGRRQAG